MANKRSNLLPAMAVLFLLSLTSLLSYSQAIINVKATSKNIINEESKLETYIVFVTKPDGGVSEKYQDLRNWYQSFFPETLSKSNQKQRIVYSYKNVASGFAAKLTAEEAKAMEENDGFLSARPQKILSLHTTHSPSFLGLQRNYGLWRDSNYGKGVIVGLLDTGISPDHPSFSDDGMPSPPGKWKGKCDFNGTVCNNKLIGARNFISSEHPSTPEPFDDVGHGTHTASTAAGNFLNGANVFGNANGTAVGMAPLAHLSIYKVCDDFGCAESDILAAMDTAVDDGVDVLSLSLGGGSAPFFADSIAVGAFGAMQNGIFVSCSAGNAGPFNFSLSNEAPWILTVGASTIDRNIRSTVKLGNNVEVNGESLFQPLIPQTFLPLVYPGKNGNQSSAVCEEGSLETAKVKGKIVLCDRGGLVGRVEKGQVVKDAGGIGMILVNEEIDGFSTLADAHVLLASHVSFSDGQIIKSYINSTTNPTAMFLFEGTVIGVKTAPMVASFSSRGPSLASPGILKPDIIGPGVSILAAWPVSVENKTNTKATFNIISGTSMSCPHLSGIAALLRSDHPDWSPAAIKSAIMTTADLVNLGGQLIDDERLLPADILAIGAGHVNPPRAHHPGLVYDIQPDDYIPYLCGLGYSDRDITYMVQRKIKCSDLKIIPETQLNYPSFSVVFGSKSQTQTYTRTVTNVGRANSTYTVSAIPPPGVTIAIAPAKLVFSEEKQTETYTVTFTNIGGNNGTSFGQGFLIWASTENKVRSQILVLYSNED